MCPLSERLIIGPNKRAILNFSGIGKHQKKCPQEVERASFRVDRHKRINHFPKHRADERNSSENAPKPCDVPVMIMYAVDVFSSQVDSPPLVKECFRGDGVVGVVRHRLELVRLVRNRTEM
jgi:hypothetical protein